MDRLKLMFDTCIFNHILDGGVDIDELRSRHDLFATHIQEDEIEATKKPEGRRELLIQIFKKAMGRSSTLSSGKIPTESTVWDVSKWDEAKWVGDENLYDVIKESLDRRNKSKPNNIQDALIAETAIVNGHVLVTHDGDLYAVVSKLGGKATNLALILG